VSTTGLYEWYYTIGLRTSSQCLVAASFLVLLSGLFAVAASADSFQQPRTRILSAGDSFINHHLGGFLGTASVAWAGHLVHVALPASRGQSTDWSNLLHQLPHPGGLKPFVTLEWGLYSTNGDQWNHVFGLADASVGTSVLSFLGTRRMHRASSHKECIGLLRTRNASGFFAQGMHRASSHKECRGLSFHKECRGLSLWTESSTYLVDRVIDLPGGPSHRPTRWAGFGITCGLTRRS
jgi:Photosystem I psaA/psaB protein